VLSSSPAKFPVGAEVPGVWPPVRGHKVNPEMKSLVSSRGWKWALLHGGSLPAQSGVWAASLVVSVLEISFLQAIFDRPKLLSD